MHWLPIVGRELRVAARKRSTFWLRVSAAAAALVLSLGGLILTLQSRIPSSEIGTVLFHLLTWTCLTLGLSAGLFLTADCLSEEKREGTLGLLFLTELRGYDVALGKLMATSLRGLYALLAVLPILAITLLIGGITGVQFWKGALALLDGLFLSLTAGLMVSALSRDSQRALAVTFLIVLLLALGGPVVDSIIAGARKRGFTPVWSLASPGYLLTAASAWGRSSYWAALGLTQLLGWLMFLLACLLVPHTWQERSSSGSSRSSSRSYAWKFGGANWRRWRRKLLDRYPIAWLVGRERWQALVLWAMTLLSLVGMALLFLKKSPPEMWVLWTYLGGLFTLALYVAAASQAGRFFATTRRSGLLELLLVTPVGEHQLVSGQWRALRRQFVLPLLLLLGVYVAASALSQIAFQRMTSFTTSAVTAATTNTPATGTNLPSSSNTTFSFSVTVSTNTITNSVYPPVVSAATRRQHTAAAVIASGAVGVRTLANLLALCWFGMWMGLTSRSANLATAKALLFVQVIPWFVINFASMMFMAMYFFAPRVASSVNSFAWWPVISALLTSFLAVVKDAGFIIWSRDRLRTSLRERAAQIPGHPQPLAPPPIPRPSPQPPPLRAAA